MEKKSKNIIWIVLILLCIVFALYFLFRYCIGCFPVKPSPEECRVRMVSWCANCEITKTPDGTYKDGSKMSDELKNCIKKYQFATSRDSCNGAEIECKNYLPRTT